MDYVRRSDYLRGRACTHMSMHRKVQKDQTDGAAQLVERRDSKTLEVLQMEYIKLVQE